MDKDKFVKYLKTNVPSNYKDLRRALELVVEKVESTKAVLSEKLIDAQNQDEYGDAREIIDVQEELSEWTKDVLRIIGNGTEKDITDEFDNKAIGTINKKKDIDIVERTDYSQYSVDDTVAYDIDDTPVTNTRPAAFSLYGERYTTNTWQEVLVKICALLYKERPAILKMLARDDPHKAKKWNKISVNPSKIRRPKKIPGTEIWVETNVSAQDNRRFITDLLAEYGIFPKDVKLYFSRDYSALHKVDMNEKPRKKRHEDKLKRV